MYTKQRLNFFAISMVGMAASTIAFSAFAHTTLEVPVVTEDIRTSNNIIIGHGCGERNVIGTSVVFPDGVDSTVTVNGQPHTGTLADFVEWGNSIQKNYSRAIFSFEDEKADANGNVSGFWAGGGNSLPHHLNGYIPFRVGAVKFVADSCAASVKFHVSIVDICEITPISGFNDDTVNKWTLAGLGTPYDRTEDGAASLTITRTSALPESCGGTGTVVEVKPSAAQLNRDMPIKFEGSQVWPQ